MTRLSWPALADPDRQRDVESAQRRLEWAREVIGAAEAARSLGIDVHLCLPPQLLASSSDPATGYAPTGRSCRSRKCTALTTALIPTLACALYTA